MKSAVFEFFAAVFNITQGDFDSDKLSLRDKVTSLVAQLNDEGLTDGQVSGTKEVDDNDNLVTFLRFYFFCMLMENTPSECIIPTNLKGFHIAYQSLPFLAREKLKGQNDCILLSMRKDPEMLLVLYMWQQAVEAKKEGNEEYHVKCYIPAVRRYLRAIRYLERLQKLHYRLFTFASSYGHPSLPQPPWEDGCIVCRKRERAGEEDERTSSQVTAKDGDDDEDDGDDCDSDDCDSGESNEVDDDDSSGAGQDDGGSEELEENCHIEDPSGDDEDGEDLDMENDSSHLDSENDEEDVDDEDEEEEEAALGMVFTDDLSPIVAQIVRRSGLLQRLLAGLAPPGVIGNVNEDADEAGLNEGGEFSDDGGDHLLCLISLQL